MSKISLKSFKTPFLYCIIDRVVVGGRDPVRITEAALRGGADLIQWRDKNSTDRDFLALARMLRAMTHRHRKLFIVNDRVSIAQLVQADGVHVGHEDLPVQEVRRLVGESMLIGRSTHSLQEAKAAQTAGADYIGVGPVFATPTKPTYPVVGIELIQQVNSAIQIPWVAIGGIDLQTLPLVLSAGARGIAVVRALAGVPDPEKAARTLKTHMSTAKKAL